jgi:hypothetical protein
MKGITGHELCKYFWDPAVRMEWEGTLDSSRMIEAVSDNTLIFHQVHKVLNENLNFFLKILKLKLKINIEGMAFCST